MSDIHMPRDWSPEEQVKHIVSCPMPDDPYWTRKRWWQFWRWFA